METMDDYKELLEASFKRFRVGDIVTGVVISVDEEAATLDFNYYAPGKIYADEFSDNPDFMIMEEVKVGDSITATVIKTDDGAGNLILSCKDANHQTAWNRFREWKNDGRVVEIKITDETKGGVTGYLEGIRAFIPASKLDLSFAEDLKSYVGKKVKAIIITADEPEKKLVLSCREILLKAAEEEKKGVVSRLTVGAVVNGTVLSIKDYGAFVDIGEGISGLLHISQIPYHKKLTHPKYAISEGQTVKVKVTKAENGKVSLSMKDLEDPTEKELDEDINNEYIDDSPKDDRMAELLKKLGF